MVANITIHSVIENLDGTADTERTHTETVGRFSLTADGACLAWQEKNEDSEVESQLFVVGDTVKAERHGSIESSLTFTEGKRFESLYKIGPYAFDCAVTARRVKSTLSEGGISVTVVYEMELGGAVRLVKMKIRADVKTEVPDA